MKRNSLSVFKCPKQKLKPSKTVSSLKNDVSLFSRLFSVAKNRDCDMLAFFKHENQPFPSSISDNASYVFKKIWSLKLFATRRPTRTSQWFWCQYDWWCSFSSSFANHQCSFIWWKCKFHVYTPSYTPILNIVCNTERAGGKFQVGYKKHWSQESRHTEVCVVRPEARACKWEWVY